MRVLSLFSGIGGIDLAAHQAGMETVAFCEIDSFCQKVLNQHWPEVPIYDDIRTITKNQLEQDGVIDNERTIDLVAGGFPCQSFSIAGKQRGKSDDRYLWPQMFRVIQELRPTWVLGENVVGLVKLALDDVIADLESEGYTARTFILPASSVGAPHRRDRVFIVAHSSSIGCDNGCNHRQKRSIQNEHKGTTQKDQQQGNRWFSGVGANGQTVANTNRTGQQECNVTSITEKPRFNPWQVGGPEAEGTIKSSLGGDASRISRRLDGHRWPAFLGQEQNQWEPLRVAVGVKDRKNRLKALGNAVVPSQVYPILKAIVEAEAMS